MPWTPLALWSTELQSTFTQQDGVCTNSVSPSSFSHLPYACTTIYLRCDLFRAGTVCFLTSQLPVHYQETQNKITQLCLYCKADVIQWCGSFHYFIFCGEMQLLMFIMGNNRRLCPRSGSCCSAVVLSWCCLLCFGGFVCFPFSPVFLFLQRYIQKTVYPNFNLLGLHDRAAQANQTW